MIDDCEGLWSHASEAFRAGIVSGREDFFKSAMSRLSQISVKYETAGLDDLSTVRFHVAEEACRALMDLKHTVDAEKQTL